MRQQWASNISASWCYACTCITFTVILLHSNFHASEIKTTAAACSRALFTVLLLCEHRSNRNVNIFYCKNTVKYSKIANSKPLSHCKMLPSTAVRSWRRVAVIQCCARCAPLRQQEDFAVAWEYIWILFFPIFSRLIFHFALNMSVWILKNARHDKLVLEHSCFVFLKYLSVVCFLLICI